MSSATTISSCSSFERAAVPLTRRGAGSSAPQEKLALVIPALREAGNLRLLLGRVRAVLAQLEIAFEILVVDDDSRDGTHEIVSAIAVEDTRVRLLVRTGERGLAGAVVHGWRHTDATILGVMDADGQHPAEAVPELVTAILGGRDLVIGSRYVQPGGGKGWHPFRGLLSAAGIMATRPLHTGVRDPLSGFFVVRRQCVENMFFQPTGFKLLLEILVRGRIGSVEEVPFAFGGRMAGRSKLSIRVVWDYLALLFRLYCARLGIARSPQPSSGD
jgi:dolichol-phosphate mannosyltransferase